ncbi:MAG TPA: hypothetical protein PKC86_01595 [Candidatus Saccharibacteria bacterium]|nr:hypothetical protein [Candidatus Saccharibacteria bacterium]
MIKESELVKLTGGNVNPNEIGSILHRILPEGGVFHGYSSLDDRRVIQITESVDFSDQSLLLGYGVDGNAERALVRALITYVKREKEGLDYISADQFNESRLGQIATGRHPSRFDNIVWVGDFRMHQEFEDIVAYSSYGAGPNMGSLEVRSSTAMGAVVALADNYKFGRSVAQRMSTLPPVSLE